MKTAYLYISGLRNTYILTLLAILCFFQNTFSQAALLSFSENKNQWPEQVLFMTHLHEGQLFLEKDGLKYNFYDPSSSQHSHAGIEKPEHEHKKIEENGAIKGHSYKVYFKNYNHNYTIVKENKNIGYENFYLGNDTKFWASGVESFRKITYKNIYSHIDLCLYDNGGTLKYDFIIHPGGNPNDIQLEYTDVSNLTISQKRLEIKTSVNTVYENAPISYQIKEGNRHRVFAKYKINRNVVSYRIAEYDTSRTLIIDPDLIFSTYSGSEADNWGFTATYDHDGYVYSGGIVQGIGYPVSNGAYQMNYNGGGWDIGIIKYSSDGINRIYATYLGGTSCEMPHSLIVNSKNELLILGTTGSADFPVINAYDNTFNGGTNISYDNSLNFEFGVDIFVSKIQSDGTNLLASTYIGGTENDGLNFNTTIPNSQLMTGNGALYYNYGDGARGEIMVDNDDNVYVGSCTYSTDFPTVSAFQPSSLGKQEGVAFKMNSNISAFIWSSYYGGSENDIVNSIDVDEFGNAYITGGTESTDIFTTIKAPFKTKSGGTTDAFVAKISANGTTLEGASYFGSEYYDQAHFVRIDVDKQVYIYGQTEAKDSTLIFNTNTNRVLYGKPNSGQFIAKFSNTIDKLLLATVFGTGNGKPNISPTAFEVDICNRIYLAGVGREWPEGEFTPPLIENKLYYDFKWDEIEGTKGMDVTLNCYRSETDGQDFYFMVLDDKLERLDYATFFGELFYCDYYYLDYNLGEYVSSGCPDSGRDHVDGGTSRFDSKGNIYQSACASCGGCQKFPTKPDSVWSNTNESSNCNNAVVRFRIEVGRVYADFDLPELTCSENGFYFNNTTVTESPDNVKYTWDFGDGSPLSNEKNPYHTYTETGTYIIKLWAVDSLTCNIIDSVKKTLVLDKIISYNTLETIHLCYGESTTIGFESIPNSTTKYKWTPADNLNDDNISNPTTDTETSTDYILNIDRGVCSEIVYQRVEVHQDLLVVDYIIEVDGLKKDTVCLGDNIKITIISSDPVSEYYWYEDSQMQTLINSDITSATIETTATTNKTYYIRIVPKICAPPMILEIPLVVTNNEITSGGEKLICKGETTEIWAKNLNPENPVIWTWEPRRYVVGNNDQENVLVKPIETTDFEITAITRNGCIYKSTVQIVVNTIDLEPQVFQDIVCHDDKNGAIILDPTGFGPFQFLWENGETNNTRYDLVEGKYSVTITDDLGCIDSTVFIITNPELLQFDSLCTNVSCEKACNGIISIIPKGGSAPYKYAWSNRDTTSMNTKLCSGNYYLTLTDYRGCSLNQTFTIDVTESLPILDAFAEPFRIYRGQTTTLYPFHKIIDSLSYRWIPDFDLDDGSKPTPIAKPDASKTYYVIATDVYGCSNYDTTMVEVVEFKCDETFIFVPTAFSPNNDGVNDILFVKSNILTHLQFAIFDRWGEKVFETNDLNIGWDGKYKGKELAPAVFVYYIEATCMDQTPYIKEGNITLIR
ncbi:MAG: gliding motility-associated C-terminal domain-containing protein [Bacteroidales bacterium]|nr:gliding motility-associated C-terminal domain-containing protein [Bacteroidales bacterium]